MAAQTTLSPGDIAFTGYDADDNTVNGAASDDDICFVLLRAITAGTEICFTDFGWRSDAAAFQTPNSCGATTGAVGDGALKWTATGSMSYGAQVRIRCKSSLTANIGTVTGVQATYNYADRYLDLAIGGDQVFAFQGSLASPTLIAAIGMNGAWDLSVTQCTFSSSISVAPSSLVSAGAILNILPEVDNARFKTTITLSGNAASDRALLNDPSNWDVDNINAFLLPAALSGLPVRFVGLSVTPINNTFQLKWTVAEETQVREYQVERSSDGYNWTVAGKVAATAQQQYSWTDNHPLPGAGLYRVRSIDLDGRSLLSRILRVDYFENGFQVSVFPNPSVSTATVQLKLKVGSIIQLELFDDLGKIIRQKQIWKEAGMHQFNLENWSTLPPGYYRLLVTNKETGERKVVGLVKK